MQQGSRRLMKQGKSPAQEEKKYGNCVSQAFYFQGKKDEKKEYPGTGQEPKGIQLIRR